jgi:hypothetical protein
MTKLYNWILIKQIKWETNVREHIVYSQAQKMFSCIFFINYLHLEKKN